MTLDNVLIVLSLILFVFIIVTFVLWFIREYKNTKDSILRVLMILILIACSFPVLIFYLDDFNFFANMGYLDNANSTNWHSFFATYGSTLVSTMISAVFLVWATGVQINSSRKDNNDLAKEELRLQHFPVLKFNVDYENGKKNGPTILVDDSLSNTRQLVFANIHIKNIGLGTAQNFKYLVILDSINTQEVVQDVSIVYHNKDEEIIHSIYFDVPSKLHYFKNCLLLLFYEDLLGNKYIQKFECHIHSYSPNDSEENVTVSCNVTPLGNCKNILDDYSYKDEKEYKIMKTNEEHDAEQKKIYKLVKDKDKLNLRISEYLKDDINVIKMISDYFINEFPVMEGGGIIGGLSLKDDKYIEIVGTYSMGVNQDEYITLTNTLTFDVKHLNFISFKFAIKENKLKISSAKLKEFKKYLERIDNERNK